MDFISFPDFPLYFRTNPHNPEEEEQSQEIIYVVNEDLEVVNQENCQEEIEEIVNQENGEDISINGEDISINGEDDQNHVWNKYKPGNLKRKVSAPLATGKFYIYYIQKEENEKKHHNIKCISVPKVKREKKRGG